MLVTLRSPAALLIATCLLTVVGQTAFAARVPSKGKGRGNFRSWARQTARSLPLERRLTWQFFPAKPTTKPTPRRLLQREISPASPIEIFFVCLANMSRSPAAARVMLNKTAAERWGYRLKIRSAGIGSVIAEAPADAEVVEVAAKRHYDLGGHKRRQFFAADLRRADLVIAMNRANRRDILKLAATEPQRKKVHLLGSFSPLSFPVEIEDHSGYGRVRVNEMLRQIEAGCDGLITQLTHELNTRR